MTRDPSSPKAQELAKDPGITVIQGDAANPDELFKHKPDGLFLMLPSSEDEVQLTNAVADAAAAAGVKYIVYSGVDDSGCHGAGIDRYVWCAQIELTSGSRISCASGTISRRFP